MAQASEAALAAVVLIPGLELGEETGRGAGSVVYRATRGGRQFAVKLHQKAQGAEGHAALGFRREAAYLARLRHPALPNILEVGEAEGRPYLVMDYVEGQPLSELIRKGPLDPPQLVEIAKALGRALAEVHRHSLVHRDVKPDNILLDPSGHPKLIDFGLATKASSEAESEKLIGTVLYCAPEQSGILRRPVDGRADLYALGVVLFECATGRRPFESNDVGELLRQHAVVVPPSVRQLNPDISPGLAAIIAKLLSKDPDDRYQSGEGLVADLDRLSSIDAALAAGRPDVLGHDDDRPEAVYRVPLIGRSAEMEKLRAAWQDALAGHGKVVLVEGPAGSGKSRLVRELLETARGASALIVSGKCSPSDPMPFAPLRTAIEDHLRRLQRLPEAERRAAEEKVRRAAAEFGGLLKRFSPRLSALLGDLPDPIDSASVQDQFSAAVAELFLRLGAEHPAAVLFIDDAQWLDDASRRVLMRVADRLDGSRLLVATTARNDPESVPNLNRFAQDMAEHLALRLTAAPLEGDDVSRLVSAHLGGGRIDPGFIRQLSAPTGGNPFAVGEYIAAMLDAGLLRPSWGSWIVDGQALTKLQLSADAIQLVVKRLDGLEENAIEVLSAAALLGSRFHLDALPLVCKKDPERVHLAIAQATQARLIERAEAGDYVFVHDRIQEALLARLTPERTRALHQQIAEVMDAAGGDSTEYLVALARHYALGHAEKNPRRVYETHLAAGLRAKDDYADEEAYAFLEQARKAAAQAGITPDETLYEALGSACARTSRLDEAVRYLRQALDCAPERLHRARIRTQLALVHMVNMDMDHAWDEIKHAFAEAQSPWPRFAVTRVVSTLGYWLLALLCRRLRIGYGTATGEERERYRVLARIYEIAEYFGYFSTNTFLFLAMCLRPMLLANRLGPSREMAIFYGSYAVILGVLGFRKASDFYAKTAVSVAEQIGDREAVARSMLLQGFATHFRGEAPQAEKVQNRCLDEFGRWLDPNDYMKGAMDLCANLQARGYLREALGWVEKGLRRGQTGAHHYDCYAVGTLAALGRPADAGLHLKKNHQALAGKPVQPYLWGETLSQMMFQHLEQDELGAPLDETIERYRQLRLNPRLAAYHLRVFHLYLSYVRLEQCVAGPDGPAKGAPGAARRALLMRALRSFRLAAIEPHLRCHLWVHRAALAWLRGRPRRAWRFLSRAEDLAGVADSPWAAFEIARMRARLLADRGEQPAARRQVQLAAQLAATHGWVARARRLRAEFGAEAVQLAASQVASPHRDGSDETHRLQLRRQLDALLQVSLASAAVLDPEQLARVALDELVRILGAERAYLFLAEPGSDELTFQAGRAADGQDLAPTGYSTSVVERVRSTRHPFVMSGGEEGEQVDPSQSVVVNRLRSIMAAPLLRRDRLMGVVYLDNRLARGVFTSADVEILLSIANHIAISIETARIVEVEKERAALEKDLAVTAAVQSLFLPKQSTREWEELALTGYFRAAAQSGGDWWWYERRPDGRLWVVVGDVTGHGAGSAMVSAAIASSYTTLRQLGGHGHLPALLDGLNTVLQTLCGDAYRMTASAIEVDPQQGALRWWNAGAPPLLLLRADGRVEAITVPGTPLGTSPFQTGHQEVALGVGDRLLVFSDGVSESRTATGGMFGLRRLRDAFAASRGEGLEPAREQLVRALDEARGDAPQEDDITLVLVERRSTS